MKLIPLDAVLAEIEKLYQQHSSKEYIDEAGCVLDKLEDIINSIEVKEVDLEKELSTYLEVVKATDEDIDFVVFAKHFFELGVKAQKGE